MKITSRINTIITFLIVITLSNGCGSDSSDSISITPKEYTVEEPFTFDVNITNQVILKLTGINGEVDITGTSDSTTVKVSGTKRVDSNISNTDAEQQVQDIEVRVLDSTNEISVESIQPKDTDNRNYTVDYAITLPEKFQVQVINVNGAVILDSIENDVTVNLVNGQVTLLDTIGSSSINIVNGAMECRVTLPLNSTVKLNTVNGNINLSIPAATSADFSAKVSNGSINTSSLVLQNEIRTATTLSGVLGSGQGTIFLETTNGNISASGF